MSSGHQFGLYQQGHELLSRHIVRSCATQTLVTPFDDKQMAVLDACGQCHIGELLVLGQLFLQEADEHVSLFSRNMSGRMVLDTAVGHTDKVAAHGHISGLQFISDAGSLQRAAPFINLLQVIAKDSRIGHLTTGMKSHGHSLQHTRPAQAGQFVHVWCLGIL